MILKIEFERRKSGVEKHKRWFSLVKCDDCGEERTILKRDAIAGKGDEFCANCSRKGKRNANYGKTHSIEIRQKISESLAGENHPMFGKRHSKETCEKIAKSLIGKNCGEENHNFGKNFSEEWREKIGASHRGEKCYNYGKHLSEETRQKLSLCHKGEKNYNWRFDLTQEERENNKNRRYNPKTQEFRKLVLARDNYTDQITGKRGGKLIVHHLYNWEDYPDKRFNINNGVTISEAYHILFHKIYGYRYNTPEQFEEFKQNILNFN